VTGAERLVAACRGEPVDATPVWFMRQAGGQLPGYLALRERHSVLDIARTPELCAEVSVGAVDALGVDGAVLFADIMLLVQAMGVELELTPAGPVLERPVTTDAAIQAFRTVDPEADLGFVLEAIRLVRSELQARRDAAGVIGIAGGPFTLAAYLIEGSPSRDQLKARALMHARPDAWNGLLTRLADATIAYVQAQVAAGAAVVQLFDTWASSLTPAEYRTFVAPHARRILASVDVPTIHHVARSAAVLEEVAAAGGSVVGIDSRQDLAAARRRLGNERPVQGNLDPALVLAGRGLMRRGAEEVLAAGGGLGHVFNLGEAAPRDVEPAALRDLAQFVHERSFEMRSSRGWPEAAPSSAAGAEAPLEVPVDV
jgi:uroporphyrinogen decarboxylase